VKSRVDPNRLQPGKRDLVQNAEGVSSEPPRDQRAGLDGDVVVRGRFEGAEVVEESRGVAVMGIVGVE
jgi:hypothetical protein